MLKGNGVRKIPYKTRTNAPFKRDVSAGCGFGHWPAPPAQHPPLGFLCHQNIPLLHNLPTLFHPHILTNIFFLKEIFFLKKKKK